MRKAARNHPRGLDASGPRPGGGGAGSVSRRRTGARKARGGSGLNPASTYAASLSLLNRRLQTLEKASFVEVDKKIDMEKDGKQMVPVLPSSMVRTAMRMQKIRTWIPNDNEVVMTSAANAVFNTVTTILPTATTEVKTYSGVYDTCRTLGMKVMIMPNVITTATGAPNTALQTAHGAIAYDAVNNGTYASTTRVLAAQHHYGPVQVLSSPLFSGKPTPPWWHIKIPRPAIDPAVSSSLLDSNWVPTSDATVVIGYLKPYIEACGNLLSGQFTVFILYDMEFVSRS